MYGFPVIRSIAFVVAASVIVVSCSNSPEALPTSTEQVVSTTAATTTETPSETTEELVERLGGAVVRLDVAACDGEYVGAGFLIDEHHIVTVAHNIVGAELIAATTGDEIAIAEPVGMDVLRDIALLRTDIPMGDVYFDLEGSEPIVGQDLVLFGFPLGLDLTVTRGIVSNADVELPEEPLLRFIQIDAAANPGNSGGPVVTADGDLIGILQSGIVGFEGLNFATKLTVVERLLNSWIDSPALPAVDCGTLEEESASTGANTTESTSKPTNTTAPTPISATPTDSGSEVSIHQHADRTPNSVNLVFVVTVSDPDGIDSDFGGYGENGSGAICVKEHSEPNGETNMHLTYICRPTDERIFLHQYADSRGNVYRTPHTISDAAQTTTSTTPSVSACQIVSGGFRPEPLISGGWNGEVVSRESGRFLSVAWVGFMVFEWQGGLAFLSTEDGSPECVRDAWVAAKNMDNGNWDYDFPSLNAGLSSLTTQVVGFECAGAGATWSPGDGNSELLDGQVVQAFASGECRLPDDLPSGTYTIRFRAESSNGQSMVRERTFEVPEAP